MQCLSKYGILKVLIICDFKFVTGEHLMTDKVIRIFISSTQCLLIEDRQAIINTVLQHGAFPIAQEYDFQDSNAIMPLNKCEEKVENADAIILVINTWYGSIIQEDGKKKKCTNCKIKNICPYSSGEECRISYTHYEYLYANYIGKGTRIYVMKREGVDSKQIDDQTFVNERTRCQSECKRLQKACTSYCRQSIVNIPTTFYDFIRTLSQHMISIYGDEKTLIQETARIIDLIKKECNREDSTAGLYPYSEYKKVLLLSEKYQIIKQSVVEEVFPNQAAALEDAKILDENNELYIKDSNDDRPLIRVLCFRGNSFVNGAYAQWEEFILSPKTRNAKIEYLLADLDNEEVLRRRFSAFERFDNDYEHFKRTYQYKMSEIEKRLLDPSDAYDCRLFLHKESNLPFRMLFIGDLLYLSFFFNNMPATTSPVYKTRKGTSLYTICEEYFNRIKNQSIEKKGGK